jgi:SAM-dependent methyltransferase
LRTKAPPFSGLGEKAIIIQKEPFLIKHGRSLASNRMDIQNRKNLLKNPLQILQSEAVLAVLRKLWANNHVNLENPDKFIADFFAFLRERRCEEDVDSKSIHAFYERKLKEHRIVAALKKEKTVDILSEALRAGLVRAERILDFGCGKLTFLKIVAEQNSQLKKLVGIDAGSRPNLENTDTRIEFVQSTGESLPIEMADFDIVVSKLVFHHLKDEEEILKFLGEIRRIMKPGGKFYLMEESFPQKIKTDLIKETRNYLKQFDMCLAEEVTADFLNLTKEEKLELLFLNDWLMNLKNLDYMPWTFQYKTMEDWASLGKAAGFASCEKHFIGIVADKKRKQGVSALLIFE